MTRDKLIFIYLKNKGIKQPEIKRICNISTTKYHNIAKEKDLLSKEERDRLGIIFPETKNIRYVTDKYYNDKEL